MSDLGGLSQRRGVIEFTPSTSNSTAEPILTLNTSMVNNDVTATYSYKLSAFSTLSAGGGYNQLYYPDGNGISTNSLLAHAGLNRRLDARNSLFGEYSFSQLQLCPHRCECWYLNGCQYRCRRLAAHMDPQGLHKCLCRAPMGHFQRQHPPPPPPPPAHPGAGLHRVLSERFGYSTPPNSLRASPIITTGSMAAAATSTAGKWTILWGASASVRAPGGQKSEITLVGGYRRHGCS